MAALTISRRLRSRARSQRGAELIELVLVTPIFLILIGAMFDFGFLFRNWEVVTNAAREGARVGVLPAYKCDNTTTDVSDRITAYMNSSGITDNKTYVITLRNAAVGKFNACVVDVQLTQSLPSLSIFGKIFGGNFGNVQLHGAAVMRTESQAAS
jgi:Flp pilus assembly protein TadG